MAGMETKWLTMGMPPHVKITDMTEDNDQSELTANDIEAGFRWARSITKKAHYYWEDENGMAWQVHGKISDSLEAVAAGRKPDIAMKSSLARPAAPSKHQNPTSLRSRPTFDILQTEKEHRMAANGGSHNLRMQTDDRRVAETTRKLAALEKQQQTVRLELQFRVDLAKENTQK